MLLFREVAMEYFDLHCDTLYKATVENTTLNYSDYHISIDKAKFLDKWVQLFAIWIPDEIRGEEAKKLFLKATKIFENNRINNDTIDMRLSVENASMLNGDIRNIDLLVQNNVQSVTLTWNDENELGCGAGCTNAHGLTSFGKEVVKRLEENNISVDLSHASDELFYDVINIAKKPVIATHSNSRAVTDVKRNLTDIQFKIIRDMGGIVGLNFYKGFLNTDEEKASIDDLVRHAEHFLNLGGEHTLAIGSDFDGADMPGDIKGIETIPEIYQRFEREFGVKLTKNIFFNNANMYFTNFDNMR